MTVLTRHVGHGTTAQRAPGIKAWKCVIDFRKCFSVPLHHFIYLHLNLAIGGSSSFSNKHTQAWVEAQTVHNFKNKQTTFVNTGLNHIKSWLHNVHALASHHALSSTSWAHKSALRIRSCSFSCLSVFAVYGQTPARQMTGPLASAALCL